MAYGKGIEYKEAIMKNRLFSLRFAAQAAGALALAALLAGCGTPSKVDKYGNPSSRNCRMPVRWIITTAW